MEQPHNSTEKTSTLLILVQAVDLDDALMGFFHEWLREASKEFTQITVLALRVGRYQLPSHVQVIPLRPHHSRSRLQVIWTMWKESWKRRHDYQAVFVRGDAQYVLLTGWLWRLLGKHIVFWYAHYKVNRMVLPASWIAHVTTASVPEAMPDPRVHVTFIGQNIPHEQFTQRPREEYTTSLRALTLGRVVPVKGIKECAEAFTESGLEATSTLTIIGPRPDGTYEQELATFMKAHPQISWGSATGLPYDQVARELRQYDILLNAYPASLDKVIVESMMSGVIPVVTTKGLRRCLPEDLTWLVVDTHTERVDALRRLRDMSPDTRYELGKRLRQIAIQHHSLHGQIRRIKELFTSLDAVTRSQ